MRVHCFEVVYEDADQFAAAITLQAWKAAGVKEISPDHVGPTTWRIAAVTPRTTYDNRYIVLIEVEQ